MLLSKALTCIEFFLYKKQAFLSRRRIPLAILLYEQSIHLTQITLYPNIQLLSHWQHAYKSFLSFFLVLYGLPYCDMLGELRQKCLHEHELQLSNCNIKTVFSPKCKKTLVEKYILTIFAYKFLVAKIKNCK